MPNLHDNTNSIATFSLYTILILICFYLDQLIEKNKVSAIYHCKTTILPIVLYG
jgi:hypothetical protein